MRALIQELRLLLRKTTGLRPIGNRSIDKCETFTYIHYFRTRTVEIQMQLQSSVMGNAFASWSDLTDEYMAGMQALRRREPGASARMIEISKLMNRYQQDVGGDNVVATLPQMLTQILTQPPAPRPTHWLKTAAATLFRTCEVSSLEH